MNRPDSSLLWLLLGFLATALAGSDLVNQLRTPPTVAELAEPAGGQRRPDGYPSPDFGGISFVSPPQTPSPSPHRPVRENPLPPQREEQQRTYVGKIRVYGGRSTVYVRRQ